MNAREMLEDLGYEELGGLEFEHKETFKHIYFDCDREISCYSYHSKPPTCRNESMTPKELEASYKFIIELGWL